MRLKNKIALVTGSSTGIGEAMASRFASEGARVMIHGLDLAECETVARKINTEGHGEAGSFAGNIERPEDCAALVAATAARFGGLNILVNNAAIKTRSNIESTNAEIFDRTIAINLRAPLFLIKAALPHFRKAGGAAVLNIGSMNAYCGEPNQLDYSISKGGLMTLTRNLADAHGRERIRFNQFNVGWVLTPNEYQLKMKEGLPADWPQHVPPVYAPSGRMLSPADIAHYALAFVDDAGALLNGAVLDLEQFPLIGRNPAKG